ncbi:30S ribosomal protein S1 [bacterium HR14]|nr:30S ribosomal protein S1 [bacterium HR14]
MWQDDTMQTSAEQQPVNDETTAGFAETQPVEATATPAEDAQPVETPAASAEQAQPDEATAPSAETPPAAASAQPEAAPAAESATPEEPITMDEAIEQSFRSFEKGEIIRATVVQVDREGALVDVGTKTEVRIPLSELSAEQVSSAEEVVKVGDEIEVKVLKARGEAGTPVLSKREADFERLWEELREAYQQKRTLEAPVVERVKGGVVVDIGVRCFVPASQIARRIPPHQLDKLIGETLPIKIIDLDEEKRKAVASHKLAEEEIRQQREREERERRERIFSQLQVGQRLQGKVKRLTGYGAFVDIGGYEGLLHVSEIAWTRVDDPAQVLKEGDEIEVVVIRLEPENGKVALSRRQLLPDPWALAAQHYREGDVIEAPVSRVVRTGAFVKLEEGIEGFIPMSELTSRKVRNPEEVVKPGDTVKAKVIEITPRRRWMVLSVRALEEQRAVQEHQRQRAQSRSSGFTIGDRLSAQLQEFQQLTQREEGSESAGNSGTPDEIETPNA